MSVAVQDCKKCFLQQVRMLHLHLSTLRQLGQGQQHLMEVGQVVQHRGIEEIRLADSKVCSTCLEEQHNVLVAQELRKDEGLV